MQALETCYTSRFLNHQAQLHSDAVFRNGKASQASPTLQKVAAFKCRYWLKGSLGINVAVSRNMLTCTWNDMQWLTGFDTFT